MKQRMKSVERTRSACAGCEGASVVRRLSRERGQGMTGNGLVSCLLFRRVSRRKTKQLVTVPIRPRVCVDFTLILCLLQRTIVEYFVKAPCSFLVRRRRRRRRWRSNNARLFSALIRHEYRSRFLSRSIFSSRKPFIVFQFHFYAFVLPTARLIDVLA